MHRLTSCDEMVDRFGRIRSPWAPVITATREIGPDELARRTAALNRQMGLAAPFGSAPRQPYDPVPAPLTASEFATLEAGIAQRAALLDQVLEDVYGAQTLLRSGALPPALVFAEPHFIRGMHTANPLPQKRLSLYAADVIRTPDGRFALLRDYTGVIPGLGHALTIRRLTATTLPELFRAGGLRSLRPAREMLVDSLQREAGPGLAAVLSTGGGNPAPDVDLVDEALLARALGLMLIEPSDLAMRNGALHMKTLSGLLNVTSLIRGISGLDIDPLEQGGAPWTGIPGAFGAIRAGVLAMHNAPGSRLLDAPALRKHLSKVLATLAQGGLKLDEAAPGAQAEASKAPFFTGGATLAAPLCFRLFAWQEDDNWRVLPGGLGFSPSTEMPGLGYKDIWVLDSEEPRLISGAAPAEPPTRSSFLAAAHLPSRLADNLFWLGRSVERLEAASRLLMLALPRLESGTSLPRDVAEQSLLSRCLAKAGLLPEELAGGSVSGRMLRQTLSRRRPLAGHLREVGRLVNASSERLSPSMLATVRFALHQASEALPDEETALPTLLSFSATFAGIAAENMSREGGWLFLEMGRRLERAISMAESLAILLDASAERLEPGMALGIELADSVLSYELSHAGILAPGPVLAMLLADPANPRALAFQYAALRACLERLGAEDDAEAVRLIQQDVANLAGQTAGLRTPLVQSAAKLRTLSDRVQRRFFTLLPAAHALDDEELLEAAQ